MDYKSSGVNIDAGNAAVKMISSLVKGTCNKNVLSGLGHFGAFYEMPSGYKQPVLVSCTDGVGTKLAIAIELGIYDTIGIDLVAMNVNDLICSGAKPLFFLDYIACHKLIPEQVEQIIKGIVAGCKESNCSLVGGEMAEMNDLYRENDFDLAGFALGVVEKSAIIDGSRIEPGMKVYGLTASGIHSNGYSLARKVLTNEVLAKKNLEKKTLLTPTKIYVKPILDLLEKGISIAGLSHITGGGLPENIKRILPQNVNAVINKDQIPANPIFEVIQKEGNITDQEMFRVFNMGIGMVIITSADLDTNDEVISLGSIEPGDQSVILK